jgi:hypothetical protein
MKLNEETAVKIIFDALDVGLDGACDAFEADMIGALNAGDGFNCRNIIIGCAIYQICVTRVRVPA